MMEDQKSCRRRTVNRMAGEIPPGCPLHEDDYVDAIVRKKSHFPR
ncbi:hypothetical protein Pan14r_44860 [Crateriforma conspicua]|uniref:Uncharacterized protein n=1 Tax=Crateriforma conspicua TaxID=2527996 RepID=A0A5C5YB26_9PLAN|nr:hypothetical protein Mal65_07070 [Crateriforma conspicua]TWT72169.1 hypothetical protein Pan14r_44860 [Crateriforma conspicua]